jgi:PBP1b-binding outer membrane lipoprotein LpoB
MTKWLQLAAVACVMLFALGLAGCSEEGPAEKAGKKIDQAVEQAGSASFRPFSVGAGANGQEAPAGRG